MLSRAISAGLWASGAWFATVALGACSGVLGIEELKTDVGDAGADEDASTTGKGGSGSGGGGASATGGRGGGGIPTGQGGTAGSPAGGTAGLDGGPADGGSGGSAGSGAGGSGGGPVDAGPAPVIGKVIDYWRAPIENVTVTIGATTVTTDADGEFTISDVAPTYDVNMVVTTRRSNGPVTFGWVYEGLTRRDPTLQVYKGRETRSGDLTYHISNVPFTALDERVAFDIAGSDGQFGSEPDGPLTTLLGQTWVGPPAMQGTAHALRWTFGGAQELPTGYIAHDTRAVAISETAGADVTFDLAQDVASPIAVALLNGTAASATSISRTTHVYVRFPDNTAIPVVADGASPAAFSYVVPSLPNSSIMVAVADGYSFPPYSVAYADNLAPGQAGVAISAPAPATLTSPSPGATGVNGTTPFRWSGGGTVSVVHIESNLIYDAVFVVTSRKETRLPAFPSTGFALPANSDTFVSVEAHGDYASVDEATGPEGFFSQFVDREPRGPRRGSGFYTDSERHYFMTAP